MKIEFYQVSPEQLANLINERLKKHVENLISHLPEHTDKGDEFLSRKETAKFFGTSLVTLHDWSKKGLITPYKMGNRTYFKKSELVESLLNSNKKAS